MPNHWILKTDADTYPFDSLVRDRRTVWDGISNALALKHVRSMAKGDPVMIYHSGDDKAIVDWPRSSARRTPIPRPRIPSSPWWISKPGPDFRSRSRSPPSRRIRPLRTSCWCGCRACR